MALPSSEEVIGALIKDGFHPRGKARRGSHQAFRKELPEGNRTVIVILGKTEIPRGTLRSMIRQAGPTAPNLLALLR